MRNLVRMRARDQMRTILREAIVGGDFRAGDRLDEVGLASRVGASRTPVREALIALEEEGLVQSRANHGFAVATVNETTVRDLYPILGALEAVAVETSGHALSNIFPPLLSIHERLLDEQHPPRRYLLDRDFHRTLTGACANRQLLKLLELLWNQASLVDGGAVRGMADFEHSCADHAAIVEAVKNGDAPGAARMLKQHWHAGQQVVLRWMQTQA